MYMCVCIQIIYVDVPNLVHAIAVMVQEKRGVELRLEEGCPQLRLGKVRRCPTSLWVQMLEQNAPPVIISSRAQVDTVHCHRRLLEVDFTHLHHLISF